MFHTCRTGPPWAVLLVLLPLAAGAAELDPATGKLAIEPGTLHNSLDGPGGPGLTLRVFDAARNRVDGIYLEAEAALEGAGALLLGGAHPMANVHLSERDELMGRRVELKLWVQPRGTQLRMFVAWHAGDEQAALEAMRFDGLQQVGLLKLIPTGVATSDGWLEYSSGPIDFAFAGRLPPNLLLFDDRESIRGQHAPDPEARVAVDALQLVDLGPAAVPDAVCNRASEDDACGSSGVCSFGRCADHAAVRGPLFVLDADREGYLDRRHHEMLTFAGHGGLRARLPAMEAVLERLRSAPDKRFWEDLREAWYALGDGHASAPVAGFTGGPELGLCFGLGEADRVPGAPTVPLVFGTNPLHPVGGQLEVGDAVLAIDGLSPQDWYARVGHELRYNGDPRNRDYVATLQLARVAALYGSVLTLGRCEAEGPCSEAELQTFELDLGAQMASLWQDEPLGYRRASVPCDGRFSRPVQSAASFQDGFITTREVRGATEMMINATPAWFTPGLQTWLDTVDRTFTSAPARFLLDQRMGNGGGFQSIDRLMGYLEAQARPAQFLVPWLGSLETPERLRALFTCAEGYPSSQAFLWCGGGRVETPGEHPGPGRAAASRVAVLIGRDVSGNDFLTLQLKRRTGPTRIFGPGPTYGAFGMIMSLSSFDVGVGGGGLQATDASLSDGPLDQRLSGPGVEPDVVILQTQSDALAGVDTVMEAAHAWLQD